MHVSVPVKQRRVYVVLRELPDELRPRHAVRHLGTTVFFTDPRTTRAEAVAWLIDNATVEERNVVRAAYGQPPVGQQLDPAVLDGLCWPVPEALIPPRRLPSPAVDSREQAQFSGPRWR